MSRKGLALLAASLQFGCASAGVGRPDLRAKDEVIATLSVYRQAVLREDAGAIAGLFEEDATVSHGDQAPIVGRENIRKFLDSFAAYRVLSYQLEAQSTETEGNSATQTGTYAQTVVLPTGTTVHVQGTFRARWKREGDKWLMRSMHTASL